jgi:hypothetical protein
VLNTSTVLALVLVLFLVLCVQLRPNTSPGWRSTAAARVGSATHMRWMSMGSVLDAVRGIGSSKSMSAYLQDSSVCDVFSYILSHASSSTRLQLVWLHLCVPTQGSAACTHFAHGKVTARTVSCCSQAIADVYVQYTSKIGPRTVGNLLSETVGARPQCVGLLWATPGIGRANFSV